MSGDRFSEQVLLALADAISGDNVAAVDRLVDVCPTPQDGFAACCGFANIIALAGKRASDPSAAGPLIVELVQLPGYPKATEAEELAMSDVAAFIAANGNLDMSAAWTVYQEATCTAGHEARGAKFLSTMLTMAAVVARDSATPPDRAAGSEVAGSEELDHRGPAARPVVGPEDGTDDDG